MTTPQLLPLTKLTRYRAVLTPYPRIFTPANSPTPIQPGIKQTFSSSELDIDAWARDTLAGVAKKDRPAAKIHVYRIVEELVKEITFVEEKE